MRVLLDTHVWLWMLAAPEQLRSARALIVDARVELLLSAASSWEIAIKYTIGRLPLPSPPAHYVPDRIRSSGVVPLAVEHSHTLRVAELPRHHNDPFDRLLVAQAQALGVPLMTADPIFDAYELNLIEIA